MLTWCAAAIALSLCACTGSPDSVTIFGARGTAAYDNAGGAPAFDEVAYGYGAALTWNLPTKRSTLQDEQQLETLELLRSMERSAHDAAVARPGSSVTVETGVPAEKKEDGLTLQIKGAIGAGIAALLGVTAVLLKKHFGIKLPSLRKKKEAPP